MFLLHNRRLKVTSPEAASAAFEAAGVDPDEAARFGVSFADASGLVTGRTAAADLLDLLRRWRPFSAHGMLVLEGHAPLPGPEYEGVDPGDVPHVLNWGMHFPSRQFMMPYLEFERVIRYAGLEPASGVHGRLYPDGVSAPDDRAETRFFSVARYVPAAAPA